MCTLNALVILSVIPITDGCNDKSADEEQETGASDSGKPRFQQPTTPVSVSGLGFHSEDPESTLGEPKCRSAEVIYPMRWKEDPRTDVM